MVVNVTRAFGNGSSNVPMLRQPTQRGFADPMVPIGAPGTSTYNSGTNQALPCPDCPTDCTTVDEVVTMFVSPKKLSDNDKEIPVIRTGRVCRDEELDIDCETKPVGIGGYLGGLRGLGNTTDSSDAIIVTDPAAQPAQEASSNNTLLLVGVVAAIATLATVALTSGSSRRR